MDALIKLGTTSGSGEISVEAEKVSCDSCVYDADTAMTG